ncbi:hypothetical protein ALON55S_06729 [Alishewanella longhuensis]
MLLQTELAAEFSGSLDLGQVLAALPSNVK